MSSEIVKHFSRNLDLSLTSLKDTPDRVYEAVEKSRKCGFHSLTLYPTELVDAGMFMQDVRSTKLCAAIAYPHGRTDTEVKEAEVVICARSGAKQCLITVNHSFLIAQHLDAVKDEIYRLTHHCKLNNSTPKVIAEAGVLSKKDFINLLTICERSEVEALRVSTFNSEDSFLVYDYVKTLVKEKKNVEIEVASNIKRLDQVIELIKLGVSIISTPYAIDIVDEINSRYIDRQTLRLN